ncbi:MAG: formylglycine-generating enzyme family protein [Magnetococcales bacterium]|nr:formylglycine-generating enzyme family protein [Magnetococcales bacterium]
MAALTVQQIPGEMLPEEKCATALDHGVLMAFLLSLRTSEFPITPGQLIDVHHLLLGWYARFPLPSADELAGLIAPLLCSSPGQQDVFHAKFLQWHQSQAKPSLAEPPRVAETRPHEPAQAQAPATAKTRNKKIILILLGILLLILAFLGWQYYPEIKKFISKSVNYNQDVLLKNKADFPNPSPAPDTVPNKSKQTRVIQLTSDWHEHPWRWVLVFLPLLGPLLCPIWIRIRQAVLVRKYTLHNPETRNVDLTLGKQDSLVGNWLDQTIFFLRRHDSATTTLLDVPRTAENFIKKSVDFIPIFCQKATKAEYLILVETRSEDDLLKELASQLYKKMCQEELHVQLYGFSGNPRYLQALGGDAVGENKELHDLVGSHGRCRLLLISDGRTLFLPGSTRLFSWCRLFDTWAFRAILTPNPRKIWGRFEQQLHESGFLVAPATSRGMVWLANMLARDGFIDQENNKFQENIESDTAGPYPHLLHLFPGRFESHLTPNPDEIRSLIRQLRIYLGPKNMAWLGSLAVFPLLKPTLTWWLGQQLQDQNKQSLAGESGFLQLARLPWFRKGSMPDWLRLALLETLLPHLEQETRNQLQSILLGRRESQKTPDLTLNVAPPASQWQDIFQGLLRRQPEESILREQIFLDFMLGRPMPRLGVAVSRSFSEVLRANKTYFSFCSTVILVSFALGMGLWWGYGLWQDHSLKNKQLISMEFVSIPAGCFQMGSPDSEKDRDTDEGPVHQVCLDGFEMGKHEVTQEQWKAVMGNNPSNFSSCGDECPVENVSWNDAQKFIQKLNARGVGKFRLPTEAEWEYAARAGTSTPFWFGDTIHTNQANYNGDYVYGKGKKGIYREKTMPVGSFPANGFGLHDMHGNVWEWVEDWYCEKFYETNEAREWNPLCKNNASGNRVLRGGSWNNNPGNLHAASRNWNWPDDRFGIIGFRVVHSVSPQD